MTAEKTLLLRCLRDFCHGEKTERPEFPFDGELFFRLSHEQDLAAIVYEQCRAWLDFNSCAGGLKKEFLAAVFCSVNRADMLREIAERFQAEDIPFVCMKGAVYRAYYPIPELRSMGDVDFVIHTEDREKSNRILMEDMGFQRMINNHAVWTYWFEKFQFEVHDHMFYEHLTSEFDYCAYFDHVWDKKQCGPVFGVTADNLFVPEENFHFLYLMTHTAKHVVSNGMGFRAFLDMVFMARACADKLDWAWLEKELDKMKLLAFTRTCFALCERWFGVKMPLDPGKLDEGFFEEATGKIFQDGVFGLDNEANEGAGSAKEIRRSTLPYGVTALQLTIKKLFPPYEDMQLIPWYSFVDGRPWLLPAAWVYRWGYCLVHKRKTGSAKLTEPFMKKDMIEKREELIQSWGL